MNHFLANQSPSEVQLRVVYIKFLISFLKFEKCQSVKMQNEKRTELV